jgi:hypothetical protein
MRSSVAGSILLVVFVYGGSAWAAPRAWELVWRSETATERSSVAGKARTMLAGDGAELSATATASAAQGKTRFDYQTRRRQWSLIDDGRALIELDPRRKRAQMHARPRLVVDRALAERNYVASQTGKAVIAGRPATAIAITPRGGGPAVLKLWLDQESGFALKRERYNVEGKLVSATEYVEVVFGAPVSSDLFTVPPTYVIAHRAPPKDQLTLEQLGLRVGFHVGPPSHLPAGYVLVGGYEAEWGRWELQTAELRYTDGIRMLSVYERERGQEERGRQGARGRSGRGHDEGGRRHRGGRRGDGGGGRGRGGGGHGFGPPGEETSFVDRGYEKALRYFGPTVVVIVVGDLTQDELLRVARSVPQQ